MPAAKFLKYGLIGGGVILGLALILMLGLAFLNTFAVSTGLESTGTSGGFAPQSMEVATDAAYETSRSTYPSPDPSPTPGGYIDDLEGYELTDYTGRATTDRFAEACATLRTLKADSRFHFRSLRERTNTCRATFFASEADATAARGELATIADLRLARETRSVTALRARVASEIELIRSRLSSIQRTIREAETDYDELRALARDERDTASLTKAITDKVTTLEMLRQRELQLIKQLTARERHAQELAERIGMAQFSITIDRRIPITDEDEHRWARAWEQFTDQLAFMRIALTAYLGIFILWVVQTTIYLAIVLVFVRGLWAAGRYLWRRR